MGTYQVKLDGYLTSNSTRGVIAASMFTKLHDFLLYNSSTLGTQIIAEGAGFVFDDQHISPVGAPSSPMSGVGSSQFNPADRGCVDYVIPRGGSAEYFFDVEWGGTSGQWFCARFASASVPFDIFVHYFSGSRSRPDINVTNITVDSGSVITNYNTSTIFLSSTIVPTTCSLLRNYMIRGISSSYKEGDFSTTLCTGFNYLGSNTTALSNLKGGGLAIQIAQRADGGEPWALGTGLQTGYFLPAQSYYTTMSNLSPDISYPWTSGSSVLGVFPISNAVAGGAHVTSSKNLFPIIPDDGLKGNFALRYHVIANEDNILIVTTDAFSSSFSSCSYKFCYFGKYDDVSSTRVDYPWIPQVPYVFLASFEPNLTEPTVPVSYATTQFTLRKSSVIWGSQAGDDFLEGGSWHPTSSYGVSSILLDLPGRSRDPYLNPNYLFVPPKYDRYSFGLWFSASANIPFQGISYLGRVNELMGAVSGLTSHDQTSDLKYAVVGNQSNLYYTVDSVMYLRQKLVIPWNGSTLIGTNMTEDGLTGSVTI